MGIILMWRQMRINRCRNEAYRISFPHGFTFLLFASLGNLNFFSFVLSLLHKCIVFLLRCYVGPRSNHLFELLFIEVSPALYMLHALINYFFFFLSVFCQSHFIRPQLQNLGGQKEQNFFLIYQYLYKNVDFLPYPSSKDRQMQLH